MKKLMMVAVLVLGGMVACNLASAQDAGKEGKKKMPSVQERLDKMTDELKLTDEQKPKVKEVLEAQQKAMEAARSADQSERRQKFRDAMDDASKKMKDILTPDQYEKYQKQMDAMKGKRGGGKGGDKKGDNKT